MDFDTLGGAEGVAVSHNGDVFLGLIWEGLIFKVVHGNFDEASVLAEFDGMGLFGMDVDRHGNLYAAVDAPSDDSLHGVWKVQPDGTAELVAALPLGFQSLPNGIAIDNRGNVYVSDSYAGRIWRLTPDGDLSVWVVDDLLRAFWGSFEFGVNGLAYHRGALYAAITLDGRVVRIPIESHGAAGTPELLIEDASLVGIDGIELDWIGNIYLTNNFAFTIQRITKTDLIVDTIVENDERELISSPSELALSRNHKTIYVANLSESGGAVPGPDRPLLIRVTFPVPVDAWTSDCDN
jgi:sugar lactone lactonase YvrE